MPFFLQPYLIRLAYWSLLLWGRAAATEDGTGIMQLELVFPRNETYNPSPIMPIVISVRNTGLLPFLYPSMGYEVWSYPDFDKYAAGGILDFPTENRSGSDSDLAWKTYRHPFNETGTWRLHVHFYWSNCYEEPEALGRGAMTMLRVNSSSFGVTFTTKGPLRPIDLVAATNNQSCSAPAGIAINVTNTVRTPISDQSYMGDRCPVVPSSPTKADKCAVSLDKSAVASFEAYVTSWVCGRLPNKPDGIDCSSNEESTALRLVAGGATCLALMLGAFVYFHNLL
ncbi:hypothetical protein FSST1_009969 [Fusarium sambucinum]